MTSLDRGYTILLSHLHSHSPKLSVATIQGAFAHHLANTSPLPTPLAATAISSPFYLSQPFTNEKLQSFATAFRHASHLKYRALVEASKTWSKISAFLGRSTQSVMGQWVTDILKGVHGGHPVLRLAACSGLLLGVEDVKIGEKSEKMEGVDVGSARSAVENETVVALAEVMDTYAYGFSSFQSSNGIEEWEKEFQPAGQDILSLVLILASQSLPLVAENKLKALPLPSLARLLTSTISSAFKAGTFLSSVSASVTLSPNHQVHISPSSPLAQTLQSMLSSPLTASIPSISKLTANILALLIDSPSSSRLPDGMRSISEALDVCRDMAKQVERDWIACPLASFTDLDIASDSKDMTKSIWTTLKTLLFSTIMLAEAVLSASVYIPPQTSEVTPASLALQTLQILSHLSFVISEFGGVTTTTQGFEHLKKTFYLALDILAQGDGENGDSGLKAEGYVQQICFALNSQRAESAATSPRLAKQAFALASIEQLVPVLSDKCIRDWVWGVCYPHLSDPSYRETYESAHSVVLAIFASHAQRHSQDISGNRVSEPSEVSSKRANKYLGKLLDQNFATRMLSGMVNSEGEGKNVGPEGELARTSSANEESALSASFVKRMIPFYASCLIDNSVDGKLNTPQLRLAYSALVRSASVSAATTNGSPDDIMYTLAWYCVQLILDKIHELSSVLQGSKGQGKAQTNDEKSAERLHRLHLMMISTISSLPLPLMLRALDETRLLITAYPSNDSGADKADEQGRKAELVEALFSELLEKIGDREKEAAMRWWYKYRPALISEFREEERLHKSFSKGHHGVRRESGLKEEDVIRETQSDPLILSRL
ncbi:hypothetical protein GALMADRAFT_58520 [Galerina marginata CBS 339.88]|uniref:Uncharacterized protein n=1 Tax=Galerina marginata (strain CBS 339.88) TaxID=685588 RepID=A0A067TTM7_GALM3|nr:hypothetical protein GALMADRAFT_58520 [Galerina marginata CBS 339.88]